MLYFGLILVRLQHNPCLSKQRIYLFIILDHHPPALPRLHSDWHVELPFELPPPPKAIPTGHERFLDEKGGGYPLILLCNYCSPLRLNQFSENQIRWPKSFSFLLTSSNISLSNRGRAKHRPDTAALTPPTPPTRAVYLSPHPCDQQTSWQGRAAACWEDSPGDQGPGHRVWAVLEDNSRHHFRNRLEITRQNTRLCCHRTTPCVADWLLMC